MSERTPDVQGRILVVDDDAELGELIGRYLSTRGFVVEVEGDGERGFQRARAGEHSLLVLDVMLPGLDGFEVLRRIRSDPLTTNLPVVMLTAHGDETDRIVGLELGADDYLPKPFNPRELLARISAVLRRARTAAPAVLPEEREPTRLHVGDIELSPAARTASRNSESIELTSLEFDLLHALMRGAGTVVTRDELARDVLRRKLLPLDRSLDIHVSRLRSKLWPAGGGLDRIKTVRGVGYLLTVSARPN